MREIFGVDPEVVPGEVEAALSFAGATAGLEAAGHVGPYLVVDIGGGSTEFVLGTDAPEAARSVDVGCVRMRERRLLDDPPTKAQIAAATADIDAAIATAAEVVPLADAKSRGRGGRHGHHVGGDRPGPDRVRPGADPPGPHSRRPVREIATDLLSSTKEQRAAIGVMHPGRVDVIAAGALVLDRVLHALGDPDLIASEHDILDGIAASLLR